MIALETTSFLAILNYAFYFGQATLDVPFIEVPGSARDGRCSSCSESMRQARPALEDWRRPPGAESAFSSTTSPRMNAKTTSATEWKGSSGPTVYSLSMRFPLEQGPAYLNSQVYRPGGDHGAVGINATKRTIHIPGARPIAKTGRRT